MKNSVISSIKRSLIFIFIFICFFANAQTNEIETKVFSYASESLVKLNATGFDYPATGFIISNDGYVLTCYHVIEGLINKNLINKVEANQFAQIGKEKDPDYSFIYIDGIKQYDIALLKLKLSESEKLKALSLGDSGEIKQLLTTFLATGYPDDAPEPVPVDGYFQIFNTQDNLWRVNSNLRPGNSGSPIFSLSEGSLGKVLGIAARATLADGNTAYGYVTPINLIKNLLKRHSIVYLTESPQLDKVEVAQVISRNYPFYFIYDEHKLSTSRKEFCAKYEADSGYKITKSKVIVDSSAKESNVRISQSSDGSSITLCVDLESGSFVDQWRGWYIGTLITEQVKNSSK